MACQLRTIYNTIAAVSVTAGGKTPTVYNLDSLPDVMHSASVPARLLLPVASNMEGRNLSFVLAGTGQMRTAQWKITDLLLWQAQAQGRGLEQVAGHLVDYVAAYVNAVAAKQPLISGQVTLEDMTLTPGVFLYPSSGATAWFGVEVVWQIKEIIA